MDFDFLHSPTSVLDFEESEFSSSGASDTSTETETESEYDYEDRLTMDFEARSRDGAWYEVQEFVSFRDVESGDEEALVRLGGLGSEVEEWVNVGNDVRERSFPCVSRDCPIIYPGDLILCLKDALYYDAHVLDAQRHRHDVRGCHCNFLVQYDHDQSQETVPLRKICRRPETGARLRWLRYVDASGASTSTSGSHQGSNVHSAGGSQQGSSNPLPPPPAAGGSSGAAS